MRGFNFKVPENDLIQCQCLEDTRYDQNSKMPTSTRKKDKLRSWNQKKIVFEKKATHYRGDQVIGGKKILQVPWKTPHLEPATSSECVL